MTREDALELKDEDIVVVEVPSSKAGLSTAERERVERPSRPFTRRVAGERLEDDVAGECLASISRASSRTRSVTPLTLPPPPASRRTTRPPAATASPSSSSMPASRLPAVTPPPFVRTSSIPREAALTAMPTATFRPSMPSLAPIAATIPPPEPKVIVVRERPRAAWMAGAAMIGAACAVIITRVLSAPSPTAGAGAVAASAPPSTIEAALPSAIEAAPPPAPANAQPPALTVKLAQDEAVAIPAPSTEPSPPAAPASAKPKPKPASQPATTSPLGPIRTFTPEQDLAAEQLKAAAR